VFPIDRALCDPLLLGGKLAEGGDMASWRAWLCAVRAAFGLPLDATEHVIFNKIAGGRNPPPPGKRVSELWCVVGRRSGKTSIAAAIGVYLATLQRHHLSAGEQGHILMLAPAREQAGVVLDAVRGYFERSKMLHDLIIGETTSEIRLRNRAILGVHSASYRTIRGRTMLAVILDESAQFRDETAANPDVEIVRAVMPALVASKGMLIGISSPYRRSGILFQRWRDHYGQNSDDVLVVSGGSTLFNPLLDEADIARAIATDPEGGRAEWDAEWRTDVSAFLDDALINAAIDPDRPLELPPRERPIRAGAGAIAIRSLSVTKKMIAWSSILSVAARRHSTRPR
jgi:hypothetical protein